LEIGRLEPGCRPAKASEHGALHHAAAHIVQFDAKSQRIYLVAGFRLCGCGLPPPVRDWWPMAIR